MTALDCPKPSNGGSRCDRDEDFESIRSEQRAVDTLLRRFQGRVTSEFLAVFSAISRVETKVDRLLEGVELGNVRPTMSSLEYPALEGEITGVQERPIIVGRMKIAERNVVSLEEKLAAAEARLEERARQSDRAAARIVLAEEAAVKNNELAVAKWKITAGILLAVVAACAAIGQALVALLK